MHHLAVPNSGTVKLAKCRGVSLAVLMDQLGSHFPEHV